MGVDSILYKFVLILRISKKIHKELAKKNQIKIAFLVGVENNWLHIPNASLFSRIPFAWIEVSFEQYMYKVIQRCYSPLCNHQK